VSLSITELKKGTIFELEGVPYKVVDYSQKVMGRGGSVVNVRIKNLITGNALDKTFKGNERLESGDITKRKVSFLYDDVASLYFMDDDNYDQFSLNVNDYADERQYLKPDSHLEMQFFKGQPVSLVLPNNVMLKVDYTEEVVKGDTTSNVLKDATLETGLVVKVPAFIRQNDVVKVDTRTGEYLERQK
jgi:elongation factor P